MDAFSPYIRSDGVASLHARYAALRAAAFVVQGPRAFECPKTAAAVHEAGHLIEYKLAGLRPRWAGIGPKRVGKETFWVGRTKYHGSLRSDATTVPATDLKFARSQMAGVMAELLFDRENYRAGSSLDEVTAAQAMACNAAIKLNCAVEPLWHDMLDTLAADLQANEAVVREIADVLMHCGSIAGSRLQRALAGVCHGHGENSISDRVFFIKQHAG
jgi:hypothetical protein